MEQVLIGLIGSSPAAVAAIVTCILFLKYLREERRGMAEERREWRDTVMKALENNTGAMQAQGEILRGLVVLIETHDAMSRAAIARLESTGS